MNHFHVYCSDSQIIKSITDVTIEDGTVLVANQQFVKIWKMRNEGNTAWPADCKLQWVGGDKLSTTDSVSLPHVGPGEEIDIAVEMIAPSKPGRYVSYWRLVQSDGTKFGQRVWVDLVVPADKEQHEGNIPTAPSVETQTNTTTMEVETQTPSAPVDTGATTPIAEAVPVPEVPVPVPEPQQTEPPKPALSPEGMCEVFLLLSDLCEFLEAVLVEMGFTDVEVNKRLLQKYNNNMVLIIQKLLEDPTGNSA